MITDEVASALEVVRTHLDSLRETDDPVGFMYRVGAPFLQTSGDVPAGYLELLRVADGGKVGAFQFQDHLDLSVGQLSSFPESLGDYAPELFYEMGVFVDAPVALRRDDESVWSFPNLSRVWWMDQKIERVATGIDEYLRGWVFNRAVAIEHGEVEWAQILDVTGTALSPLRP